MKNLINLGLIALLSAATALAVRPAIPKKQSEPASVQPFTYANVVAQFKAAHLRTTEVQKRCTIFFEGEWKNRDVYDYGVVMVENSDEDVQVTFYLTDAHQMNWITEFLDAPYFTQAETQALFNTMNSNRDAKNEKIGRFRRVDFHHWQPRHAEIFVFSLTPERPGR